MFGDHTGITGAFLLGRIQSLIMLSTHWPGHDVGRVLRVQGPHHVMTT